MQTIYKIINLAYPEQEFPLFTSRTLALNSIEFSFFKTQHNTEISDTIKGITEVNVLTPTNHHEYLVKEIWLHNQVEHL